MLSTSIPPGKIFSILASHHFLLNKCTSKLDKSLKLLMNNKSQANLKDSLLKITFPSSGDLLKTPPLKSSSGSQHKCPQTMFLPVSLPTTLPKKLSKKSTLRKLNLQSGMNRSSTMIQLHKKDFSKSEGNARMTSPTLKSRTASNESGGRKTKNEMSKEPVEPSNCNSNSDQLSKPTKSFSLNTTGQKYSTGRNSKIKLMTRLRSQLHRKFKKTNLRWRV